MSIVHTFILQFYLNALFMKKVGDCCIPSIVCKQYFSIIFNEKKCALYTIKYGTVICKLDRFVAMKQILVVFIKGSSLRKSVSKFTPKKFYKIDSSW
jgi:hypothetical protein